MFMEHLLCAILHIRYWVPLHGIYTMVGEEDINDNDEKLQIRL